MNFEDKLRQLLDIEIKNLNMHNWSQYKNISEYYDQWEEMEENFPMDTFSDDVVSDIYYKKQIQYCKKNFNIYCLVCFNSSFIIRFIIHNKEDNKIFAIDMYEKGYYNIDNYFTDLLLANANFFKGND